MVRSVLNVFLQSHLSSLSQSHLLAQRQGKKYGIEALGRAGREMLHIVGEPLPCRGQNGINLTSVPREFLGPKPGSKIGEHGHRPAGVWEKSTA